MYHQIPMSTRIGMVPRMIDHVCEVEPRISKKDFIIIKLAMSTDGPFASSLTV